MARPCSTVSPSRKNAVPRLVLFFAVLSLSWTVFGHPIPNIPVRSSFHENGDARIQIEIDPRFFTDNPIDAPYLFKNELDSLPEEERASLIEQAGELAAQSVSFHFEPIGQFVPQFEFHFAGHANAELENDEDPVVIIGGWTTRLAAGVTGYQVKSLTAAPASILVLNSINDTPLRRIHVLFPRESSYLLDLTEVTASIPTVTSHGASSGDGAGATFAAFLRQGFLHVLPWGVDHILFVVGLFLLSREWRPLLWQVTMFTLAHTITLGLATVGGFSVPGALVEPVIAASIAVIAIENIFHAKYTRWRLLVVFIFGLIHGLGFAGALQDLDLPPASLLIGLLGFNLGVEFGQLAVIAVAFAATFWLKREDVYRKSLVIPGSAAIALFGVWWTVERIVAQ